MKYPIHFLLANLWHAVPNIQQSSQRFSESAVSFFRDKEPAVKQKTVKPVLNTLQLTPNIA